MGKISNIVKIKVCHYDKESIMFLYEGFTSFYRPDSDRTFSENSWSQQEKELFSNTFTELDKDVYLVNEKVVCFKILNNISVSNNSEDDMSDYSLPYYLIWKDIKNNLSNFNKKGVSSDVFLAIIDEHWHQSWEGEWDCNIEYIGILDNNLDTKSILNKVSQENKINRDIEFNKQWDKQWNY
jgi:hypothetical protein